MKKQETTAPPMDEIVFEKRNKIYGAYILRKMYKQQVVRALILSTAILIAGLAYPLVASYKANGGGRYIGNTDGTVFMPEGPPPAETPVTPPPPPPPAAELEKKVRFVTPDVTNDPVSEETGLPFQDDLNKISANEPVNMPEEIVLAKKEEVIHIEDSKPPQLIVEEMPSFPGGDAERQKFLAFTIKYPQSAAENGIQGTVYVQFVVDSKGIITDAKILRGIGGGCDEEALRVVMAMPPWHPGKQNGRTVRVLYNMSVSFKIQS